MTCLPVFQPYIPFAGPASRKLLHPAARSCMLQRDGKRRVWCITSNRRSHTTQRCHVHPWRTPRDQSKRTGAPPLPKTPLPTAHPDRQHQSIGEGGASTCSQLYRAPSAEAAYRVLRSSTPPSNEGRTCRRDSKRRAGCECQTTCAAGPARCPAHVHVPLPPTPLSPLLPHHHQAAQKPRAPADLSAADARAPRTMPRMPASSS